MFLDTLYWISKAGSFSGGTNTVLITYTMPLEPLYCAVTIPLLTNAMLFVLSKLRSSPESARIVPEICAPTSIARPLTMWYCTKRFLPAALKLVNVPALSFATAASVGTKIVYGPFPVICAATPDEFSHPPKVEAPEILCAIDTTSDDERSTLLTAVFAPVVEVAALSTPMMPDRLAENHHNPKTATIKRASPPSHIPLFSFIF